MRIHSIIGSAHRQTQTRSRWWHSRQRWQGNSQGSELQRGIHIRRKSNTRAEPASEGSAVADRRAQATASEPLVDELGNYYIIIDAELVLYMLHVVVVRLQVHAVSSQSVEPMYSMGAARFNVAVAVFILDAVLHVLLALKEIG